MTLKPICEQCLETIASSVEKSIDDIRSEFQNLSYELEVVIEEECKKQHRDKDYFGNRQCNPERDDEPEWEESIRRIKGIAFVTPEYDDTIPDAPAKRLDGIFYYRRINSFKPCKCFKKQKLINDDKDCICFMICLHAKNNCLWKGRNRLVALESLRLKRPMGFFVEN